MPRVRYIVGLEFDAADDLTLCARDLDSARNWVSAAPTGRTRSLYALVSYGGISRLSDVALAYKALRLGTLIADSEVRVA